ncbi:MAG: hypothetical protein F6K00_24360 [Leptolyngbya sp. SIOISBB]|nr:hypothetical protein [Leptolyngbya sp. SIOISBB]
MTYPAIHIDDTVAGMFSNLRRKHSMSSFIALMLPPSLPFLVQLLTDSEHRSDIGY